MPEVGVVGQRRLGERRLQLGETQAGGERAADLGDPRGLVLGLDGCDQGARLVGRPALGVGIDRLAQAVPGEMADHLGQDRQAGHRIGRRLPGAQGEPVGGGGDRMAGPELEPVVGPVDRLAHRFERVPAGLHETRQLARHVFVFPEPVVALEGVAQPGQRGLGARLGRRVGEIEPDLAVFEAHRIAPQVVAADQGLARLEIELPVVPVAGQQAAVAERALAQGIALVGAAVVAGVDRRPGGKQDDLLLAALDHHGAARAQLFQIRHGDETRRIGRGRPLGVGAGVGVGVGPGSR